MPGGTRPDAKEIQRLTGIAHGHAQLALAKPETQRESYLASCRTNWKSYAAGFSKSERERERFAADLDKATRDMMALLLENGETARRDAPEGAPPITEDEAIIAYQAGYVLPALDLPLTPEGRISEREPIEGETPQVEPEPQDDDCVRYGKPVFSVGGAPPLGTIPKPAVDPELDKIRQKTHQIIGRRNRSRSLSGK